MEFYNTKIRPWIGILVLLFIGVMMIKDPNLFENTDPSGRKAFIKLIFSYIWGIPVGALIILLSGYLGYKQIQKHSESAAE